MLDKARWHVLICCMWYLLFLQKKDLEPRSPKAARKTPNFPAIHYCVFVTVVSVACVCCLGQWNQELYSYSFKYSSYKSNFEVLTVERTKK